MPKVSQKVDQDLRTKYLRRKGVNAVGGHLFPDTTETYNLGSGTLKFNEIHVVTLTADSVVSTGISSDTVDGYHASSTPTPNYLLPLDGSSHFPDSVIPNALLISGSRAMTGDLDMGTNDINNVSLVDGVDVSAHAADGTIHHLGGMSQDDHSIYVHVSSARTITARHTFNPSTTNSPFILGANAQSQLVTGLRADELNKDVTAGNGLTGGGTLTASRTLNVGAGNGITVNADDVTLTTPTVDLSVSSSNAVDGSGHTHAIDDTSDTTAGIQKILSSNASGQLFVADLGVGINSLSADLHVYGSAPQVRIDNGGGNYADLSVDGSGNLNIIPVNNIDLQAGGDIVLSPTSNDVLPDFNYNINVGAINNKLLTLHVAELWADTLVAQETIATIGGYIKVAPTTELISDIAEDVTAGSEILLNGDFEDVTGNDFANWTETVGDGSIVDEGTIVNGGSHAVKITRGTGSIFMQQDVTVTAGNDYTFSFFTRGDGTYAGRYRIRDVTNAADITALTTTGVTGTTYTQVTDNFTAPAGCTSVRVYLYDTGTNSTSCYFDDASFTTDGTINMDVKHNQMVIGDIVMMMANLKLEYFMVIGGPTPVTIDNVDGYRYSVTRNLDSTGGNAWYKGDAVLNTGQTGSGIIDLFSLWGHNALGIDHIYVDDGSVFSENLRDSANFSIFPAAPAVNDAIYFGMENRAWRDVYFYLSTAGSYTATLVYEFWNGSTWTAMTQYTTPDFTQTGVISWEWWTNSQTGWAKTTVNSVSAYWVRIRVSASTSWTTVPTQTTRRIIRESNQYGPTIAGYVRDSMTWNDVGYRWVAGNLDGYYGKSNTFGFAAGRYKNGYNFLTMTDADGFEIFNRSGGTDTRLGQWDVDGTITVGDTGDNHVLISTSGIQLKDSSTVNIDVTTAGVITIGQTSTEAVEISSTYGIRFYANSVVQGRIDTNWVWFGAGNASERIEWTSTDGLTIRNHNDAILLQFDISGNAYIKNTLTVSGSGSLVVGSTSGGTVIDTSGIRMYGAETTSWLDFHRNISSYERIGRIWAFQKTSTTTPTLVISVNNISTYQPIMYLKSTASFGESVNVTLAAGTSAQASILLNDNSTIKTHTFTTSTATIDTALQVNGNVHADSYQTDSGEFQVWLSSAWRRWSYNYCAETTITGWNPNTTMSTGSVNVTMPTVVPTGAYAVVLRVVATWTTANNSYQLSFTSGSGSDVHAQVRAAIANIAQDGVFIVPLNGSKQIQVTALNTAPSSVYLRVVGYMA